MTIEKYAADTMDVKLRFKHRPRDHEPRSNRKTMLLTHSHQRGHRFDSVPKILYAQVLVLRMLIVVVVDDWNGDRNSLKTIRDDG